ncbi:hypothetical protein AOC36_08585 [Erysipelothrix larvae]|uniref:MBG domain-containing protein n=1 Tax=Erysipelothrix larvae TaxID=1514105 RepID=A0A0X8H0Z8_9FIRM|nr:MBG domain-containing protein [Erysipelothrix larvae]AMC94041.1 hypothetical protein AOC36_08585 [Erysipelothrix larvae]
METTGLSEANGYVVSGTSCQQATGLTTSQMISMDVLNLSTGSMGSFNPSIWTKRACDTDNCYFPELSGMSQTNETVSKESTRFSRLPISMKDAVYGDFIPGETLSQVKLSASFYDQNNNPVEGIFSWVTPSTGITKGTHTYDTVFTPNDSKYKVLTGSVDVQIGTQRTLSFTVSDLTKTYGDARFDLSTLLNGNRGTGALTWTSSHPHLVSIDQLGIVTLHNATNGTVVTLSVTQADDDQYYDGSASLDLIVNKKSITVSAEDKTMIFGEMMPALTYTTTGLVGTDTLVGSLKVSDNTVGTHDIVQDKTLSHDNYNITFLKGRMVIQYPQAVNDIRDEIELIYRNLSTQKTPTTHEEALKFADEIAMLSVAYNALSEQEKGLISEETKEKLALVQKQAGETNHINDYAMVEGLPWEVRLITEPLSSTTHDYRTIRENMEDVENLTLFNMTLWNTLTNERYTLSEQEIAMITFRDYIAKEGGEIVIVHQLNDGTLEYINPTLKDGWVTFGATSFSAYGIVEKYSPPKETPPSSNVNTGNTTPDTSQETKTDETLPKTGVSQSYIPWYALGIGLILLGVSKRRKNK